VSVFYFSASTRCFPPSSRGFAATASPAGKQHRRLRQPGLRSHDAARLLYRAQRAAEGRPQCLLANHGAHSSPISGRSSRTSRPWPVRSHFWAKLPGVKVTACENTAAAAKKVAESGRTDWAALASRACAELYGLDCLQARCRTRATTTRASSASRKTWRSTPAPTARAS
jgi:hypothetical protein